MKKENCENCCCVFSASICVLLRVPAYVFAGWGLSGENMFFSAPKLGHGKPCKILTALYQFQILVYLHCLILKKIVFPSSLISCDAIFLDPAVDLKRKFPKVGCLIEWMTLVYDPVCPMKNAEWKSLTICAAYDEKWTWMMFFFCCDESGCTYVSLISFSGHLMTLGSSAAPYLIDKSSNNCCY